MSVWLWNLCFSTPLIVTDVWIYEDEEGPIVANAPRWRWSRRPDPPAPDAVLVDNGSTDAKTTYLL